MRSCTRQKRGYYATSLELLEGFIANIKASGKYATVGTDSAVGRVLQVRLSITGFNYLHGADFSVGAADIAILNVTMTVTDGETNSVLGLITASNSSKRSQGMGAPTSSRQASAIAKELASQLLGK